MTEQITCDCCGRSVEVVSEGNLCFACETFHVFTTTIKEETDLCNEDALDLAGDLSGLILSAILERLQSDERSLSKTCFRRWSGESSHTSFVRNASIDQAIATIERKWPE